MKLLTVALSAATLATTAVLAPASADDKAAARARLRVGSIR